jgi:hypothetical protein
MFNRALIALPLALLVASPAVAGISKSVAIEDALDGRVPIVVAVEGGGVNIDFSETGETVQKVTLDDTSKVLVDFDKSLPIVRLFRGNVTSHDVPSAKTTQLSVTTKGADGDFHLYIFPVTTSTKPATFTKFLIGGVVRKRGSNNIATAALGATVAVQNKTLVDPQLKTRVAHYVQLRDRGMNDRKAAKRAKISIALAKRLDDLGQSAPTSASVPVTALPVPSSQAVAFIKPIEPLQVAPVLAPKSEPKPKSRREKPAPSNDATVESVVATAPNPKAEDTLEVPNAETKSQQLAIASASGAVTHQGSAQTSVISSTRSKPKTIVQAHRRKPLTVAKAQAQTIDHQAYAKALLRGLNKARLDGKIRYYSGRWFAVNDAIRTLRRGGSLEKAIAASGMKREGFMKLLGDGGLVV